MSLNHISELPECSSFDENDLFILSQRDKYIANQFNNCSIDGDLLTDTIFNELLKIYDFGSAAYTESCAFSPYNHNHDNLYNKISLDFEQYESENVLSIGNLFIDGKLIPLNIPLPKKEIVQSNHIPVGTLKFVALNQISSNKDIQYKTNTFDGWLYPDGSSFMLSDFSLSDTLNQLYGNGSYISFTLPNINNFIKLNNCLNYAFSTNQISCIDKNIALKKHSHLVNLDSTARATIDIAFPSCANIGDSGVLIPGCGVIRTAFNYNLTVNYNGQQMKISELIAKLQNDRYHSTKPIQITTTFVYAYLNVDDLETICKAIDNTYNNANAYEQVFNNIEYKLPQINDIQMNDIQFSINNSINVNYETTGEDDETYPTHTILPVMIYVGKRQ